MGGPLLSEKNLPSLFQNQPAMKIIKKIGIVLLVLILIGALVGWMQPRQMHVEVSGTMKSHPANIYNQVNVMKNWEAWSPWQRMDPEMKVTYSDIPSGVGASYSWTGPKSGQGSLTVSEANPNERIATAMDFGPNGTATSGFTFTPEGENTRVTWSFDTDMGVNPFSRLFGLIMKGMLESSFEQGLANLKEITEKMPAPAAAFKTEVRDMPPMTYLAIRDSAAVSTISEHLGRDYGRLMEAMGKQGLNPAGAPFAIYYTESETNWAFDACMPVDKQGKNDGAITSVQYPGGKMVVTSFYGPYDQTPAGHRAADDFIKANNLMVTGPPWERYITDPMSEKDTSKWLTEICYPLK